MFGPSPIRPLEKHMRVVTTCAEYLHPFFESVLNNDWALAIELHEKIIATEKEADHLKRDLRLHLPTGLFLPVSRTDLLEVLNAQDQIANKAQDIAGLIIGRHLKIPESLSPLFMPFLTCSLEAAQQACNAINELDELLESGFRGNEVDIVEAMIKTLDQIEHKSDNQLSAIRQHIFTLEATLPPIDAMFLYKLMGWIGDLADHAQTVGGRLQILIAR